ncbi:galactokinase [Nocardioides fonticola]|uniref:Galactokinase n=1 Tax=Nocardioides fonticola TaxID=450363 RepID=A0ABP7XU81_9ACTN
MTVWDAGDPALIAARLAEEFLARYDTPATCVGRAPGRVNLIGEHTDYNAGLVLPVALPHATYAAVRLREDGVVRIASSQIEDPWTGHRDDLASSEVPGWVGYAAGVLTTLGEAVPADLGIDVVLDSTVPMGAGLSSSAAIECAVGVASLAAAGRSVEADRDLLVAAAIRAETEVVGAPTGGMDQTISVFGRPGEALLIDFRSGERRGVPAEIEGHCWLVTDTRVSHALTDGGYGSRRADCERAAAALGVATLREADLAAVEALDDDLARRRARHVVTEIARVEVAATALREHDLATLGAQMAGSHASMRDDFEISCAELDTAVEAATAAGAVGARMTGGGFGGSSVALVPIDRRDTVIAAIDAAFAAAGYAAPRHLVATPSAGAAIVG